MIECKCIPCQSAKYGYDSGDPCERKAPPTTEYAYRPSARKDADRTTPFELIPLCIFAFSIGMAVGRYWL